MRERAEEPVFGKRLQNGCLLRNTPLNIESRLVTVRIELRMQFQVSQTKQQLSHHSRTRAIGSGGADFFEQFIRKRFTGFKMSRHADKRWLVIAPVLHELTGQFHGIPFDATNAGGVAVVDGSQHVLQTVSEFVKQRFHFAERHQRRTIANRRCAVANQVSHRNADFAINHTAAKTIIHPRARAFVFRTGIRIQIHGCDTFAAGVFDVVEPNILVPDGCFVFSRNQLHTEQTIQQSRESIKNAIQREVGTDFFVGVFVPLFAEAFRPKRNVPVFQVACVTVLLCEGGNFFVIFVGGIPRGDSQAFQHVQHIRNTGRHFFREAHRSIVVKAKQRGFFFSQFQNRANERCVVQFPGRRSGQVRAVDLFAQF